MNKYISLILFSIFLVACSNEVDLDMDILPKGEYPISFSADNIIMPTTKSFAENGVAGVYMTDNAVIADNNKAYVYSGGKLSAQANERYWTRADQVLTVSAYYPQNATISDISDQSTEGKYNSFDVLYAYNTVSFSERKTKQLAFDHLMSRIVINLTGNTSIVNSVKVINTITQGNINITPTSVTVSAISNKKHIIPYKFSTTVYEAVIIPQTIAANTDLVYVLTNQNQKTYKCTLDSNITFEPGKQYTFSLAIN